MRSSKLDRYKMGVMERSTFMVDRKMGVMERSTFMVDRYSLSGSPLEAAV